MQSSIVSRWFGRLSLGLAAAMLGVAALAADPTLHEVYQAAQAGRLAQAQQMMDEVLRSHPDSGKAHYVRAELFARQGRAADAHAELATAERLAPGLPFTTAAAVQELRSHIASLAGNGNGNGNSARAGGATGAGVGLAGGPDVRTASAGFGAAPDPAVGRAAFAWGPWVLGGALALGVLAFFRHTRNRSRIAAPAMGGAAGGSAYGAQAPLQPAYGGQTGMPAPYGGPTAMQPSYGGPAAAQAPYGMAGYGMPGNAPVGGGAGGIGSGLLGGLATGAAVGAGMVAGQALMHRVMDGGSSHGLGGNSGAVDAGALGTGAAAGQGSIFRDISGPQALPEGGSYDMGGNDFGVSDAASWDDGGSAGGDDWN